jgi:elongator complex protein 3
VEAEDLIFSDYSYNAAFSEEHFLNYATADDKLAGYLRLGFPQAVPVQHQDQHQQLIELIPELHNAALIREVHIYGQSLAVGGETEGAAQHSGLGTDLLARAEALARNRGYLKIVVISAIGTRQYYEKRGYALSGLYMTKDLL